MKGSRTVWVASLLLVAAGAGANGKSTGDLIAVVRNNPAIGAAQQAHANRSIAQGLGSQVRRSFADGRVLHLRPKAGKSWRVFQQELVASGQFESVEPDRIVEPCATVNDPMFNSQWHLTEISVQRAWDFTFGGNRIVAIVDSGVNQTHPDLVANLVPGYNVPMSLSQASGGIVSDINGHGTRVAGVAAAVGNNGIGVSGAGPNLKIMPIRVASDASATATQTSLLAGVQWAVQNGATAVNVSYTGVDDANVEAMGAWARSQGAFLVWAAGNAGTNWTSFDHRNVTVVGGMLINRTKWSGSGYGRGVDVFAPCTGIITTSNSGGYGPVPIGTSMATPQVAAALALMKDRFPSMDANQLERELLYRSGDLGTPGFDIVYSFGKLNVGRAVEKLPMKYDLIEIPFPPNVTNSVAVSVNNHGVVIGHATVTGSSIPVAWRFSEALGFSLISPPLPWQEVSVRRINDAGQIAGVLYQPTSGTIQVQGFVIEANGQFTLYSTIAKPHSHVNDIADNGYAAGWEYIGGATDVDGIGWSNSSSPQYFLGGPYISGTRDYLTSVNRFGQAVGYLTNAGLIHSFETGYNFYLSGSTSTVADPTQISDLGWISGAVLNVAARWRVPHGDDQDSERLEFESGSAGYSVNNSGDMIGQSSSRMKLFTGYQTGEVGNMLNKPLPTRIRWLQAGNEINDLGAIAGTGRRVNEDTEGVYLKLTSESTVGVSIGQLGQTPQYIGSIPPSLSVTFTNEAGVAIGGTTANVIYDGTMGRLPLQPPPGVTGSFRVYLRCSSAVIPGFIGPTYLNRLYPPLGVPAAPPDSGYLPFEGQAINGSPVLEMYAGDADGSGEIDATDIDIVISFFGAVNDDTPAWALAAVADCDGTQEIDASDIDLVIANFGLVGDPEP